VEVRSEASNSGAGVLIAIIHLPSGLEFTLVALMR
jgi:hypothetical protein